MAVRSIRVVMSKNDVDDVVAILNQLSAAVAELQTNFDATLAKMDADAGVTDTDYASTQATAVDAPDTVAVAW